MPFGATPRLPTPGIDGNCYGNPWPYGDHILTGMFPESYGGLGMLGYNWQEYWPADHEVMAGWADELESEDIAKIGAATALLHDNRELIEGLESLAGLLGSGTLASLADTFKNAASRVRGDYPQTASTLDPGDVDSTFGYMGATIIARRSTDNPLYKMLWHEDADATMSEIRKFVGKPDEPAAFTYPLNWTYAGNHGLSEPVAETDTTAAWDGFALPDDIKKKLSKIGGTVNVDGWWAETGLTAGVWAGGALLGHPTFYTFGAFFYSQWDDLGDALTEASTAEFANDSAASVLRGIARFWDTSGNPVATIVSAVLAIVEAIFTALHFFISSVKVPPGLHWPTKNLLTLLTAEEMLGLYTTMQTASIGRSVWSILHEDDKLGGFGLDMLSGADTDARCLPIVHLNPCMLDFDYTSFEQGAAPLRPTREFVHVLDLASVILEQYYCMDDAIMAVSDLIVNPAGLISYFVNADGTEFSCFADMLQGVSLARWFGILWRLQTSDAYFTRMKGDRECLYPAFCWLDTAAKRARIDAVVGPLRTDTSVTLDGTQAFFDPVVVGAGVFPDRYFVGGLLFRLFTGAGGICDTWECFTCEERSSVRNFFIDQKVHCACESDEEDDESDGSNTAGDSKTTGAAVRNLDLQWFLNQVATAKGVQQPNGADVGGVQPIKS